MQQKCFFYVVDVVNKQNHRVAVVTDHKVAVEAQVQNQKKTPSPYCGTVVGVRFIAVVVD